MPPQTSVIQIKVAISISSNFGSVGDIFHVNSDTATDE